LKLLILGAAGFLGSCLLHTSENLDLQVLGTSRSLHKNRNIIKLDVTDQYALKNTINSYKPDTVIWTLLSRDHEGVLIDLGLTYLLSAVKHETKLIFLSTDAVFSGEKGGYTEVDKPSLLPDEASLAKYVNAKIRAEEKIAVHHKNHTIIRTGPLYGRDANGNIEARTQRIIGEIGEKGYAEAAADVFKTFVYIDDLSEAICEISNNDYTGKIHLGPEKKESYFSFYRKRLHSLGISPHNLRPIKIVDGKNDTPIDTSLDTRKASGKMRSSFRSIECGKIK
jgi:dTDP-4-dehydrorhamnose reductase